jgi:DNA-binding NarL/FixJ family response regulator
METNRSARDGHRIPSDAAPLTRREVEVIVLIAHGLLDKQIAQELGIRVTTVRSYIERIGRKTGRSRRVGLTALAYERGLILSPSRVARLDSGSQLPYTPGNAWAPHGDAEMDGT